MGKPWCNAFLSSVSTEDWKRGVCVCVWGVAQPLFEGIQGPQGQVAGCTHHGARGPAQLSAVGVGALTRTPVCAACAGACEVGSLRRFPLDVLL